MSFHHFFLSDYLFDTLAGPKEVVIMDEFGQTQRGSFGPYNEGGHLTLICETESGMFSIESNFLLLLLL